MADVEISPAETPIEHAPDTSAAAAAAAAPEKKSKKPASGSKIKQAKGRPKSRKALEDSKKPRNPQPEQLKKAQKKRRAHGHVLIIDDVITSASIKRVCRLADHIIVEAAAIPLIKKIAIAYVEDAFRPAIISCALGKSSSDKGVVEDTVSITKAAICSAIDAQGTVKIVDV